MAFHPSNKWLMDVLEKGLQSVYANFFDITWTGQLYKGRLMVPFLGNSLEEVISNKELQIAYEDGRFVFKYFDSHYPLNPHSYETILKHAARNPNQAIQQLLEQIVQSKKFEDKKVFGKAWDEVLLQLQSLMKNKASRDYVQNCIKTINKDEKNLQALADEQVYRLCHWQETDTQINYRRFFTVNGLICLNMQ